MHFQTYYILTEKDDLFHRQYVVACMNCNLSRLVDKAYMNYLIFIDYVMNRSQSEAKLTVCTTIIEHLTSVAHSQLLKLLLSTVL